MNSSLKYRCNLVNNIDVSEVRKAIAVDGTLQKEGLQPCRGCDRGDMYVIGHHDFSEEIAKREEEERVEEMVERREVRWPKPTWRPTSLERREREEQRTP